MREARDWVRFHRELCRGDKRGIPRALRFIYMEVSLECRPKRGHLVLTSMMGDVEALHDLLGGDRAEITRAFRFFTSTTPPMWRVESDSGERRLYVYEWSKWNPVDPTGSERQQRKRDNDRDRPTDSSRQDNGQRNGDVTVDSGTVTSTSARGRVSLLSSLSVSSLSPQPREDPEAGSTGAVDQAERRAMSLDVELPAEWLEYAKIETLTDVDEVWKKFRAHWVTRREVSLDELGWLGKWQMWVADEKPRQRKERERERDSAHGRTPAAQGGATGNQYDGPAVRAERARRNAEYEATRANRGVVPIAALLATVGDKPTVPMAEERPSGTRTKAAPLAKPEIAREMTPEEFEAKRLDDQQRLKEFEARGRAAS
jgi:hypothetical protein